MSVPPFAVVFFCTYFKKTISLTVIHLTKSVINIGHHIRSLPVLWIHRHILYYSAGDRLQHVLRYVEAIDQKGCMADRCLHTASTSNHVRYGSIFLSVSGAHCAAPSLLTWLANNSTPHVRRATTLAMSFMISQLGGILGTWLLGTLSPAPNYTSATITFIAMSVCMLVFITANLLYLSRANRLKAERRQRTNKEEEPEGLGDRSAWFIYSL